MKKLLFFAVILFSVHIPLHAQDDADKLLDEDQPAKQYVTGAFKSSHVINGQSIEMIPKGALDFRILHRFGQVNGGAYEFFGLDQANIRLGLDYGITKNFTVGIGRSNFQKEVDGSVKYRIIQQATGPKSLPFSLVYAGGITCEGMKWTDTTVENLFTSRLGYYHELIVGRKFSSRVSLQLSPLFVHRNLVPTAEDNNDLYALGTGGRVKITHRIAITFDYFYVFNRTEPNTYNPLSLGVDIETGGHVFQLHFTNTIGMNERAFISNTQGQWTDGGIRFGFNISRIFQLSH